MKADLHVHSTVSDGSDTILEIAEQARLAGLDAVAVTDHDTLSHLTRLPADAGVKLVGGIEISAIDRGSNMRAHVLGYRIKQLEIVTALTQPLLEARNRNSETQVGILNSHGYRIDMDKLKRADGKYLYKQHIMEYLVATGQVPDMIGGFYNATFKHEGICAIDIEYLDVLEAVRTLKRAGGLAVLAHSGQQQNFYLVPKLVECGLDGLELDHPANSEQDRHLIRKLAAEHRLFLTGGSDHHGRYERGDAPIGSHLAEESGAQAICLE